MNRYYRIELIETNKRHRTGKWYWRLKSRNGKILAHSEIYRTKFHAKQTATQLRADLSYAKGVVCAFHDLTADRVSRRLPNNK